MLGGYSYATGASSGGGGNGSSAQSAGSWTSNANHGMSEISFNYQYHVAGKFGEKPPIPGSEFNILNYFMDGVNHARQVFIDAKGNYKFLFEEIWKSKNAEGYAAEVKKMVNHSNLARQYGYNLEYYVAEQEVVPYFEKMALENGCDDVVRVIFEPFPK